jgi:hypothetical protein
MNKSAVILHYVVVDIEDACDCLFLLTCVFTMVLSMQYGLVCHSSTFSLSYFCIGYCFMCYIFWSIRHFFRKIVHKMCMCLIIQRYTCSRYFS